MKLFTSKISLLFITLLVLVACKKQQYTLEYKLAKGELYKQNILLDVAVNQEYGGQSMQMGTSMDIKMDYEVLDTQNDLFTLAMKYNEMKMSIDAAGTKMEFTSNTTDTVVALPNNMNAMFKAMTGLPIKLAIDKTGKVKSIDGFDQIKDAMFKTLANVDEDTKQQLIGQIGGQFDDDYVRSTFEQMSIFPSNPVSIGDSWDVTINLKSSMATIKADLKYTLKSVEGNIATLESVGSLGTGDNTITQKIQGMDAKVTLNGTQTGTVKIDMNTGWTISGEITQDLKGEVEVMGIKMPQSITNKISVSAN